MVVTPLGEHVVDRVEALGELPGVDLVLLAASHRELECLVAHLAALAHLGEEREGALVRLDGLAHEGGQVLALRGRDVADVDGRAVRADALQLLPALEQLQRVVGSAVALEAAQVEARPVDAALRLLPRVVALLLAAVLGPQQRLE